MLPESGFRLARTRPRQARTRPRQARTRKGRMFALFLSGNSSIMETVREG